MKKNQKIGCKNAVHFRMDQANAMPGGRTCRGTAAKPSETAARKHRAGDKS
jgi:hypothetical protein